MGNDKKGNSNKKSKKQRNAKCFTCEYYSSMDDYCEMKDIENCTKQANTNFSKCKDYLINSKLVMF